MPEVDWRIRRLGFGNPFEALRRRDLDCAFVADLTPPRPRRDGYLARGSVPGCTRPDS
jgi:hypothetical protein